MRIWQTTLSCAELEHIKSYAQHSIDERFVSASTIQERCEAHFHPLLA